MAAQQPGRHPVPPYNAKPVRFARLETTKEILMKKQERSSTTLVTHIDDIAAIGTELSDTHLRLVAGAARNCTWEPSSSYTEPGKSDPARDCSDQP